MSTPKQDAQLVHEHEHGEECAHACALPPTRLRRIEGLASQERIDAIRRDEKKWMNGQVLKYHFMAGYYQGWSNPGDEEIFRKLTREAFATWANIGIGLIFEETAIQSQAQVRIGFVRRNGSWSFLGTDALRFSTSRPTMNIGWDPRTDATVILHEIGHALGLPHEHQIPNAGIVWDEPRVLVYFGRPPNSWDEATVRNNIIKKVPASKIDTTNWDPLSIMHYGFARFLISEPEQYWDTGISQPKEISAIDKEGILAIYPGKKPDFTYTIMLPNINYMKEIEIGKTLELGVKPPTSGMYTFATTGDIDTVMVLVLKGPTTELQINADDDSGTNRNAMFNSQLDHTKEYVLRVRVYHQGGGECSISYVRTVW